MELDVYRFPGFLGQNTGVLRLDAITQVYVLCLATADLSEW
jgi:hypothetical protein